MSAPEQHEHMALVGVRMLAQLLAMLYALLAGATLYAFGLNREALRAFAVGALIAWAVAPDKAARNAYLAFQRRRTGQPDE